MYQDSTCRAEILWATVGILLIIKYPTAPTTRTMIELGSRKKGEKFSSIERRVIVFSVVQVVAFLCMVGVVLRSYSAKEETDDEPTWWRGQGQGKDVEHPHKGAKVKTNNETWAFQMIVDPSPQRLKEPQRNPRFGIDPDILCPAEDFGIERKTGKEALLKTKNGIRKYNHRDPEKHRKSKILCMIYTVDLPTSRSNLISQAETWGKKCDGFIAASNITDHATGSIDLAHMGPEQYGNMWQKIRSMWAYAYDHYLEEYDFFHIAGDDVYIVMENLRAFLDGPQVLALENGHLDAIARSPQYIKNSEKWLNASDDPADENYGILGRPLYFGVLCEFRVIFPCGGPGYTLNRAALEVFGRLELDSFMSNATDPREDLFVGSMFAKLGITTSHTFDGNGHRYSGSAFNVNIHSSTPLSGPGQKQLYKQYNLIQKDYIEGVSEELSAMHLKDDKKFITENNRTIADLMYRYHAILYDLCDNDGTNTTET